MEITDASVSGAKLQNNSVTTDKVKDGSITNAKIAANTITAAKIAANAVGSSKIAANAVGVSELQANAVTSDKIPPNAVVTEKLQDGCVTQAKLTPGVGGGDRHVFGTLLTPGIQSAEVIYLTGQAASIPWTTLDMSTYIPERAKAVIVQLGMFTESTQPNSRAEMRVRTNTEQRDALDVSARGASQSDYNGGIVPLVTTGARILEYSLDVVGTIGVTFWVTVVGYILSHRAYSKEGKITIGSKPYVYDFISYAPYRRSDTGPPLPWAQET